MELESSERATHLPLPLLQVLNRLCQGCSWLHIDTVLHLLSEHCGSLNSLNRGQQYEHSPAGGRSDQGEGFTCRLPPSSTEYLLAKMGLTCMTITCVVLQLFLLSIVMTHSHIPLFVDRWIIDSKEPWILAKQLSSSYLWEPSSIWPHLVVIYVYDIRCRYTENVCFIGRIIADGDIYEMSGGFSWCLLPSN